MLALNLHMIRLLMPRLNASKATPTFTPKFACTSTVFRDSCTFDMEWLLEVLVCEAFCSKSYFVCVIVMSLSLQTRNKYFYRQSRIK